MKRPSRSEWSAYCSDGAINMIGRNMRRSKLVAMGALVFAAPMISGSCPKKICDLLRSKGLGVYLAPDTDITKIGDIRFRGVFYTAYYYNHADVETKHGRQAIIITRNNRTYVGAYDAYGAEKCHINRKGITCSVPEGTGDRINFTKNGPPYRISFAGSITSLDNFPPQFTVPR